MWAVFENRGAECNRRWSHDTVRDRDRERHRDLERDRDSDRGLVLGDNALYANVDFMLL